VTILGIDPGLSGGLAWENLGFLKLRTMPTVKVGKGNQIDEQALIVMLKEDRPDHAWIELVHAMPKQGVCSMFTFGCGWGLVRGILAGMGIPYSLVSPQGWQKVMLAGQPRGSEYLVASRIWPGQDFRASERCKVQHEGLVDAALICEYGRRALAGG